MKLDGLLRRKVLVWGYGLEGKSTVNFLLKNNYKNEIIVVDSKKIEENISNVKFILESEVFDYDFNIVIKSAGVSIYKEEIKKIKEKDICITSTLNILLAEIENKNIKTIAITGTKGKTTTCSILYHLLKENGFRTAILGNIGVDFLNVMDEVDKIDYLILELSSYQTTNIFYKVDYAIVLNLFPEHIDWHGNHDNYYKDKLNLLNYAKNKIVNFENETIGEYIRETHKNCLFFNIKNGFHLEDSVCFDGGKKLFDTRTFNNIKGEHIFKNICAILTVIKMENMNIEKLITKLRSFKTLQHRLEIFFEDKEKNIVYINDSIATIPEATFESLKTFANSYKNIRLVIGGFDRQQNFDKLLQFINNNSQKIKIFLVGQTGKRLFGKIIGAEFFEDYKDMAGKIKQNIEKNTAIILSPASPSYDMFKNFEERGRLFKELLLK